MAELLPVAVDLRKVAAAVGSKDQRLVTALTKRFRDDCRTLDELVKDLEDEGAGEGDDVDLDLPQLEKTELTQRLSAFKELLEGVKEGLRKGEHPEETRRQFGEDERLPQGGLLGMFGDLVGKESEEVEDDKDVKSARRGSCAKTSDVVRSLIMSEPCKRRVPFKFVYG